MGKPGEENAAASRPLLQRPATDKRSCRLPDVIGIRNRLIHTYFDTNLDIL